ncbi:armadillo-type protein [Fomitopsis serialis]|uniref:armadillo-type protein n=1 Tax=Fomitopsis serialis TaxID=139415 RepID=UPI002008D822|nr:armadillo-type protein [Neoantrodia serialis]KAH9919362.1 armadillo-type protein [Neoantrodia serialis]
MNVPRSSWATSTPEEEEIERGVLFTTVGQLLDTPKARAHMDVYFRNPNDVIELRERKWIPPAEETAAKEKDYQRTLSMSRNGSGRGGHRGAQLQVGLGPDGWSVAGNAPSRISKTNAITFGPTGVFANKDSASSNMFSKLTENPEPGAEATTARPSWRPNHEASVDLGSDGSPEAPPQRRKLNLLPRTLPQRNETQDLSMSEPSDSTAPSMSEEEAKTRVVEDSKEFFSVRDLGEAEVYFSKLPSEHQWLLVDKLVTSAIESKDSDARLVADFFSWAVSNNLCSPETFEKGFTPTADILDDIVVDAPKALDLMANMMKGAQLDEERRTRLASKSMDSDKLISLLS